LKNNILKKKMKEKPELDQEKERKEKTIVSFEVII